MKRPPILCPSLTTVGAFINKNTAPQWANRYIIPRWKYQ